MDHTVLPAINTMPGHETTKFGEITKTTRPVRRSRSFKVTDFGTNLKPICQGIGTVEQADRVTPGFGPSNLTLHHSTLLMLMLMLINSIYPRANLVTKVTTAAP